MSKELVKQDQNQIIVSSPVDRKAMENLLPEEKKFLEAALQPPIKDLNALDVVQTLLAQITTAYTRAGYRIPDPGTLALYAEEFRISLLEKHPGTTLVEVREALKAGVYGEAGEFTGLNPKTFLQFISYYRKRTDRLIAIEQFKSRRLHLNYQASLSPEQNAAFNKQQVNEHYELFLQGKLIVDFTPIDVYECLCNEKLLVLTLEEKRQINERAKAYYLRVKSSPKLRGNTKGIGDVLTNYMATGPGEEIIKSYSKRIAVLDYFDAMKAKGVQAIFHQNFFNEQPH